MPASSRRAIKPSEYKSLPNLSLSPVRCSGLANAGVWVAQELALPRGVNAPKSNSFIWLSAVTSDFLA
ncbi:MAG: hypothetical protein M3Y57_13275 [Acidobacteriota bacterium]|nr:hypothetical protein [Acidobacteriota bacterium]